jgi:hypothetical protein
LELLVFWNFGIIRILELLEFMNNKNFGIIRIMELLELKEFWNYSNYRNSGVFGIHRSLS